MRTTRRALLAGAAILAAAPACRATPMPALSVVALDWALASSLIALGHPPVAIGEPALYARWVGEPALPPGTRDIGLRLQPNLEHLAALAPDLLLIGPLSEPVRPVLERIAPVLQRSPFTPDRRPLAAARAILRELGARLRREAQADSVLASAEDRFDRARDRLAAQGGRPLLLVSLLDGRHLNVHGAGSLLADTLPRLGLVNAWTQPTNFWGTDVVAVEDLAAVPEADLVVLEPVPPAADEALEGPGLWRSLAALRRARGGRVLRLPPVWAYGDVVAAARFATLLAERFAADAG